MKAQATYSTRPYATTATARESGPATTAGPAASVVSRADGAAGAIHEARSRIHALRNRVSNIAAQLHGPRPEGAKANDNPPAAPSCAMSALDAAASALHDEIAALDEAISAL